MKMDVILSLRQFLEVDIEDVFNLSNEPYVRKYSLNQTRIPWDGHKKWFAGVLKSEQNIGYAIVDNKDKFYGQIRFSIDGDLATISLSLCRSIIGKGYSRHLLMIALSILSWENRDILMVDATINKNNTPSIKLFTNLGFYLEGTLGDVNTYILELRNLYEDR